MCIKIYFARHGTKALITSHLTSAPRGGSCHCPHSRHKESEHRDIKFTKVTGDRVRI